MYIYNYKSKFCNNSSSDHFPIIVSPNHKFETYGEDGYSYHWGPFVLADIKSKMRYIATNVYLQLGYQTVLEYFGKELADDISASDASGKYNVSIDHDGGFVWDDIQSLIKLMSRDDVVILGTGDSPHPHNEKEFGVIKRLPSYIVKNYVDGLMYRLDLQSKVWTIFNKTDGERLRFGFVQDEPKKLDAPLLVDIKITDYCHIGCKYCYQGSTVRGKHANYDYIQALADIFGDMNVFEVAIGGGEPTTHPQFIDILYRFYVNNIVPNFTTKSFDWMTNTDVVESVKDYCGGFAYSISSPKDIDDLFQKAVVDAEIPTDMISVQVVMGTVSRDVLEIMMAKAYKYGFRITLLGYKDNGRGKSYRENIVDYGWWFDSVNKLRDLDVLPTLSIDTVMASQYEQLLIDNGISPVLFHTQDGNVSMYVDAVQQKSSESSYTNHEMDDLSLSQEELDDYDTYILRDKIRNNWTLYPYKKQEQS